MSSAWDEACRSAAELGAAQGKHLADVARQRREAAQANPKHTASAIADVLARLLAAEAEKARAA